MLTCSCPQPLGYFNHRNGDPTSAPLLKQAQSSSGWGGGKDRWQHKCVTNCCTHLATLALQYTLTDVWQKQQKNVFNNWEAMLRNAHKGLKRKGNYVAWAITSHLIKEHLSRVLPNTYGRPIAVGFWLGRVFLPKYYTLQQQLFTYR